MQLKEKTQFVEEDSSVKEFKARPINPHLFEHPSRLPVVERKNATIFEEFRLSNSNGNLGKRTYRDYIE
jgi:hypothetical protein